MNRNEQMKRIRAGIWMMLAAATAAALFAFVNGMHMLWDALMPLGSLTALIAVLTVKNIPDAHAGAVRFFKLTCMLWFSADICHAAGTFLWHMKISSGSWLGISVLILNGFARICIIMAIMAFYYRLTRNANKFQLLWDQVTVLICILTTLGMIIIRTYRDSLFQFKIEAVVILIYAVLCFFILGALLLLWLYLQDKRIGLEVRLIMTGVMLIPIVDLIQALYFEISMDAFVFELISKLVLLMLTAGVLIYGSVQDDIGGRGETGEDNERYGYGGRYEGSWKNAFYFLTYPAVVVATVGFDGYVLFFAVIIMAYYLVHLYVKQIAVSKMLLEAEKKHADTMRLYKNIIEQAPMSIVVTDKDGDIEYVNPCFTMTTGYSMEEVLGKNPRILKSEMTDPAVYDNMWQSLTEGSKWAGEFINKKKDGSLYTEEATLAPVIDEENQTTHYVAIKDDITDVKKLRNKLKDQDYFTRQAFDALPNILFFTNRDNEIIGCNKAFEEAYNCSGASIHGMKIESLPFISPSRYQLFVEMSREVVENKRVSVRHVKRRFRDDIDMDLLYTIAPYYLADDSIGGFIGVMTDISELKAKEAQLEHALILAEAATQAKSNFLANMSHEIRTPMNAIIGMAYLAMHSDMNPEQEEYISKIHMAATTLLGIINDILDFSKIEAGKMNLEEIPFKLEDVLSGAVGMISQAAHEKGLNVSCHRDENLPEIVVGDPLRLSQVMINLLSNAVKFTERGEIAVYAEMADKTETRVKIRFSVRDTGIGIETDKIERLMEAFTQADVSTTRRFGGTGLGLAISNRLILMMGGELRVQSRINEGSVFSFELDMAYRMRLDRSGGTAERKDEHLMDYSERSRLIRERDFGISGTRVLLAEDNAINRRIAQEMLKMQGVEVVAVNDGLKAVEMMMNEDLADAFDMVLMDVQMPGMDGLEASRRIRGFDSTIPIIAMTARTMADERDACFEAGMNDHIAKPIEAETLFSTIGKWAKEKPNNGNKKRKAP